MTALFGLHVYYVAHDYLFTQALRSHTVPMLPMQDPPGAYFCKAQERTWPNLLLAPYQGCAVLWRLVPAK